ncbi:hypothetical protein PV325_002260 [Microctonus aethiopoides]|uniref:Uncharacterized protein n=1 Tax=Microctonus aethiopoides TaxID=144406 RepID=A0AA39FLK3_9HYME|nr:hypothetical protein PV325_002260 [Microctonus aethiopoides]KAK0092103.1 hypothetical protein PV326_002197 [Microctonus aethiopoides]KAK0171783.1 hypothetical protein PV328_005187 [Microctonus aethiopoides]
MGKTRTGKIAASCTAVAFILIVIAFTTPNWLSTDGKLDNPKFYKIGLWQVCFQGFQDIRHLYKTKFHGCWWVFEEEYYIIHDILLPDFFVATQFFFTLCLTLLLVGGFLTALYTCCSRQHQRYQELLWAIGANLTLSAICGLISVIIFGARGDSRDWMPDWEHNGLGWSFALAVIGSFVLLASGILFLVEARRHRKKSEKVLGEELKTQTTI